jgi:hypothetical protein
VVDRKAGRAQIGGQTRPAVFAAMM